MQDIHNPKTLDQWGSNGSKIEKNAILEFDCFEFCTHRGHLLQMSIWFLFIARSHIYSQEHRDLLLLMMLMIDDDDDDGDIKSGYNCNILLQ